MLPCPLAWILGPAGLTAMLATQQASAQFYPAAQERRVFAFASSYHIGTVPIGGQQQSEFMAPGFELFDQLAHATVSNFSGTGQASAYQRSTLGSTLLDAQGKLAAYGVTIGGSSHAQGRGETVFDVVFDVPVAIDVRLLGGLAGSSGQGGWFTGTVALHRTDVPSILFSAELSPAQPTVQFDLPLTLASGTYRLRLDAAALANNIGTVPLTTTIDYGVHLGVIPSPPTLVVLAAAGVAGAGRRRQAPTGLDPAVRTPRLSSSCSL